MIIRFLDRTDPERERCRPRLLSLIAMVLALTSLGGPLEALAQYTSQPQGYVGPDLGPSGRPTGVAPNSGLLPGTPARPPGEPWAGTYSPVDPLPRGRAPVRTRIERQPADDPPVIKQRSRRPPALPRSARYCRAHPGDRRCR